MLLASTITGTGQPITCVHGFTQTSHSWQPFIDLLGNDWQITSLDAPGHGRSVDGTRTLEQCGDDIAQTSFGGTLIGYSMGARMALHAVLQHPRSYDSLVLISGTPGIEDDKERQTRLNNDNVLADHIETIGVDAFIDEWLSQPLFAGLSHQAAQREHRIRNTAQGLADSLRYAGTGTQRPLWDVLHLIDIPVLVVAGEHDAKFVDIGQRMTNALPNATFIVIPQVGHTVHLEDTDTTVSAIRGWLSQR